MKNDLIQLYKRNVEGYRGYEFAAKHIQNKNFKTFLEAYARRRKEFSEELEAIMADHDITPQHDTSILGDLHHAFLKVKQSMSGHSDRAMLEECARGESMALSDYQNVLKNERFTPPILKTLMKHRDVIMAAERTMRELAPVLEDGES